jgi:hypothetical protein
LVGGETAGFDFIGFEFPACVDDAVEKIPDLGMAEILHIL